MAIKAPDTPLTKALHLGWGSGLWALGFTFVNNILYLALPIYTMQVYSRVLPNQSLPTLYVLTVGAVLAFVISGVIDHYRSKVQINYGIVFDERVSGPVFSTLFDAVLRREASAKAQALRDLDALRQALTGGAINTLFDVPWMPIFMIVLALIDPIVCLVTFGGGMVLLGLALLQDRNSRPALKRANDAALQSYNFTEAALRNGEVVRAMGMLPSLGSPWRAQREQMMELSAQASIKASIYGGAIRIVRMSMQIIIVAMGAWLVLNGKIGPGVLFANMILASRALAPIERIVGSWQQIVAGLQAHERLTKLMSQYEAPEPVTLLPRPQGALSVEGVTFAPRGVNTPLLSGVSFHLTPGETLGVVGPSGAGKSTLSRLLVGIWKPNAGAIRLDGADVYQWDRESFGNYVGYLPQDIELFSGTVRGNICRFRQGATDEAVVKAAQLAGAHEMILRLSQGYDTSLSDEAATLSGGQRQRIALARALFGDPAFLVLDEPNAALDADGEAALLHTLELLKQQQCTVVIISHKPNVFRTADKMLLLRNARVEMFGPRDQVMARLMQPVPAPGPAPEAKAEAAQ